MTSPIRSLRKRLQWSPVGAFLVLFVVTAALFVPALVGYTSFDKVKDTEVTVEDVSLAGDETLAVTYTIGNPTRSPVTVRNIQTHVRANGTLLNDFADVRVPKTEIKLGETVTVTARTTISEDDRDLAHEAVSTENVSVFSRVTITVNGQVQTITREGGEEQ